MLLNSFYSIALKQKHRKVKCLGRTAQQFDGRDEFLNSSVSCLLARLPKISQRTFQSQRIFRARDCGRVE